MKQLVANVPEVIVAADSTKLGRRHPWSFGGATLLGKSVRLVTDTLTDAQQEALTAEFRTLLVRTYSVALSNYRDQLIEYLPLRAASGDTEVTVRSTVRRPGAERLTIDYEMEQTLSGWKVYDIKIAGVSMIINYRATFADEIRESGVDGLIKSLAAKNMQTRSSVR